MVQLLWKVLWWALKDPAVPLLQGIYPKELKAESQKKYLNTNVYSSIIHNSQGIETTDEWTNKMYIHAMEYYSALKRKEILSDT